MRKTHLNVAFSIVLIFAFMLTACAPAATPTAAQEPAGQEEPAQVEPTATTLPPSLKPPPRRRLPQPWALFPRLASSRLSQNRLP
jgi:hypothetical protein